MALDRFKIESAFAVVMRMVVVVVVVVPDSHFALFKSLPHQCRKHTHSYRSHHRHLPIW